MHPLRHTCLAHVNATHPATRPVAALPSATPSTTSQTGPQFHILQSLGTVPIPPRPPK
ncbi:MAG: hypothetical protein RI907_161 [Pseudomonadota bacterium]|jgi:hypothetical protein